MDTGGAPGAAAHGHATSWSWPNGEWPPYYSSWWSSVFSGALTAVPPHERRVCNDPNVDEYCLGPFRILVAHTIPAADRCIHAFKATTGRCEGNVIGFDMEWRPDRQPGENNRVALIQLSSTGIVLLLRTALYPQFNLPHALWREVLCNPAVTLATCGWDGADKKKWDTSFGGVDRFTCR